jgi:hypothetical protein
VQEASWFAERPLSATTPSARGNVQRRYSQLAAIASLQELTVLHREP